MLMRARAGLVVLALLPALFNATACRPDAANGSAAVPVSSYAQSKECRPYRIRMEKEAFAAAYLITRSDGDIILAPRRSNDRSYRLGFDQMVTDMSSLYGATLVCYEGPAGDRVRMPSCNISIDSCQKAALREVAGSDQ